MNRKKTIFLLSFLAVAFLSSAQIDYSASQIAYSSLSMSQTNPVLGTARYSGMAGAMGALGGDASTMRDNPAGLGIYRSSDFTLTSNFSIANDNSVGFNINNFAIVLNLLHTNNQTGYITSSFGIGYNRLKNFKRYSDLGWDNLGHSMIDYIADGYAPAYLTNDAFEVGLFDENGPWFGYNPETNTFDQVSNQTRYSEEGSIGEWNFSYGVNVSNRFYFGLSAGFVSLDYRVKTLYDEWITNNFNEYWYLDNYYEANGNGFNFKFGAIAALTDFMRVGLAFHTPTFYSIDEYLSENIGYIDDTFKRPREAFPRSNLQTPLKLQGSLGFIIGKTAIIGLEYQFEDFSAMRFSSNGILDQGSKDIINSEMNVTHTAKVGAEVRIVDGLSLRGGFAFVSNPSTELSKSVYTNPKYFQSQPLVQPQNTFYYTGGIGYKSNSFYADLAFVHQVRNETFFQYLPQEEVAPFDLTLHNSNIMATVGVRF